MFYQTGYVSSEEAKQDLSDYFCLMKNTSSNKNLEKLIDIECKYGVYGGTPQMVSEEISKFIK